MASSANVKSFKKNNVVLATQLLHLFKNAKLELSTFTYASPAIITKMKTFRTTTKNIKIIAMKYIRFK